jgi:hypothetical protein
VNRFTGWSATSGCLALLGQRPSSIAGIETLVLSWTVVALRYQVESAAKSANAGNRSASIWPPGFISIDSGSASKTTNTIGGFAGLEWRAMAMPTPTSASAAADAATKRMHPAYSRRTAHGGFSLSAFADALGPTLPSPAASPACACKHDLTGGAGDGARMCG